MVHHIGLQSSILGQYLSEIRAVGKKTACVSDTTWPELQKF